MDNVARVLGMKPSEITETVLDADGVLVRTHDGVWTLIRNDGSLVHRVADPTDKAAVEPAEDSGDDEAKPAPKRRART